MCISFQEKNSITNHSTSTDLVHTSGKPQNNLLYVIFLNYQEGLGICRVFKKLRDGFHNDPIIAIWREPTLQKVEHFGLFMVQICAPGRQRNKKLWPASQ